MAEALTHTPSHPVVKTALLACAAALGLWNWHAMSTEAETSPIFPAQAPATAPVSLEAKTGSLTPINVDSFSETLQRPLFFPARRMPGPAVADLDATAPDEPAPAEAVNSAADLGTVKLIGVMLGGSAPRALMKWDETSEAGWVEAGSEVNGWSLVEIAADHVVIEAGGERQEIHLFKYR